MTVVGVGIDLVSVSEFAEQLAIPGTKMATSFTVGERRAAADHTGDAARHLAARWAAKEAVFKAWSSGYFGQRPTEVEVSARDVEVVSDAWGRPAVRLHGALAEQLGESANVHLSLTHDGDYAAAVAVLELRPPAG